MSFVKYLSLFFMLSAMARRIGEWYSASTAPSSDGADDITAMEWAQLVEVFTGSVAEAFGIDQADVRGNMRNVLD